MASQSSPTSSRPSSRPYQEYINQQQTSVLRQSRPKDLFNGPRLWRQMMIGFTCAGFVGIVMLVSGTVFIAEAISQDQPITVMLCVMGIVFGIIILAGTIILGRLLISRKWVKCQGRESAPSQCLYTCSVIYSPSLDQIGTNDSGLDPPPAYSSPPSNNSQPLASLLSVSAEHHNDETEMTTIMVMPPKYEEVVTPPPEYEENKSSQDSLPPYED